MGRTFSAVPHTYLKRGVYYFVRRIPSDLQTFYRTDRVILSLRTKSLHRASCASERLSSRLDDYWLDLRLKQTDVPGSHLLRDHLSQTHKTTVTLGSTLSHACDVYKRIKGKGSNGRCLAVCDVGVSQDCQDFYQNSVCQLTNPTNHMAHRPHPTQSMDPYWQCSHLTQKNSPKHPLVTSHCFPCH